MTEEVKDNMKGAFVASLTRNNKQIRGDRAAAINNFICNCYSLSS